MNLAEFYKTAAEKGLISVKNPFAFRVKKLPFSSRSRSCICFAESVDQDQSAGTCSLILFCTLRCWIMDCRQRNTTQFHLISFDMCLAHLSTECSVSYCDHSPSDGVRPSVHSFIVNTQASTNINQSAPNLVKTYMAIISRMSSIMNLIRPELS